MFIAPFSSGRFLLSIGVAISQAVSAVFQYLLRALTHPGAGEATCSGSSRHPSTVSKARFYTVYRWSSSSGILPLRVYPFSCAVVRLRRMMFPKGWRANEFSVLTTSHLCRMLRKLLQHKIGESANMLFSRDIDTTVCKCF